MSELCGLPRAACVTQLAQVLYLARATCYQLDAPHFEALSVQERHVYVDLATHVLGLLKPRDRSTWPAELFQATADQARGEAARVLGFRPTRREP